MRISPILLVIVLLATHTCLAAGERHIPSTTKGPGTSSGGEIAVGEFYFLAKILVNKAVTYKTELKQALKDVEACDCVESTSDTLLLDGKEKDLINNNHSKKIILDKKVWQTSTERGKKIIVIHELLGVASIADPANSVSIKIITEIEAQEKNEINSSFVPKEFIHSVLPPVNFNGRFVGTGKLSLSNYKPAKLRADGSLGTSYVDGTYDCKKIRDAEVSELTITQTKDSLSLTHTISCDTGTIDNNSMYRSPIWYRSVMGDGMSFRIVDGYRIVTLGAEVGRLVGNKLYLFFPPDDTAVIEINKNSVSYFSDSTHNAGEHKGSNQKFKASLQRQDQKNLN